MGNDGRSWILDPAGHRSEMMMTMEKAGTMVDTVFGPAEVISTPDPGEIYVCDMCSTVIPSHHDGGDVDKGLACACLRDDCQVAGEPIPVRVLGSYALCGSCSKQHEDEDGGWGWNACRCTACVAQYLVWSVIDPPDGQEQGR